MMLNPLVLVCAFLPLLAAALADPATPGIDGPLSEPLTLDPYPALDPINIHLDIPDNSLDTHPHLAPEDGPEVDAAARAEWYVCDTTAASPRLHDIDPLIAKLREWGNQNCRNGNSVGSKCTKILHLKPGSEELSAVSLCGNPLSVPCGRLAEVVQHLKNRCAWDRYAGGRYFFGQYFWLALH
ncbi:hypothetical protein EDC01DRAFT_627366 [Geopyxis carbonaria]|nr:hypothetical protein EDC01DRAFT_627366 [Geopyxis carbonaria]